MVKDLRPDLGRKAPLMLIFVGLIALFFASFYLYQLFQGMPEAIRSNSTGELIVALGMMIIMFFLYTNYVITVFRLSSGSRKAWVGMIRLSFTYTSMALLSTYGLSEILPIRVLGGGTYITWIMIAVMIAMVFYMLTGQVRKFFTPGYADEVSLKEWAMYIFGQDPFKGTKMVVSAEDPYA